MPLTTQYLEGIDMITDPSFVVPLSTKNQLIREGQAPVAYVQSGCSTPSGRDDWVEELTAGKVVALQAKFTADPSNTVLKLRELCGAHDPEVAQHLHTTSLRAQFGATKVKNAVHCTDLPEDGALEVDYFFTILGGA